MMTLANGINLPLVVVYGLVTFVPLTLLVTAIESFVFRLHRGSRFRAVFGWVLLANVISTFAGGVFYLFQPLIVYGSGMTDSIPEFVHGYRWLAPLLVTAYLALTVLVEGGVLQQVLSFAKVDLPARRTYATVLLANLGSYLVIGPFFYVATRPHFGGLATSQDVTWSDNCGLPVYYIDPVDSFVKKAYLGSDASETLVPYPVTAFLVNANESAFVFTNSAEYLEVYRARDGAPVVLAETPRADLPALRWLPDGAPIFAGFSPNADRVAFIAPRHSAADVQLREVRLELKLLDFDSGTLLSVAPVPEDIENLAVVWSADGGRIHVLRCRPNFGSDWPCPRCDAVEVRTFSALAPFELLEETESLPARDKLVVQYAHRGARGGPVAGGCDSGYEIDVYPYLGASVRIRRGDQTLLHLGDAYGLLDLGLISGTPTVAVLPRGEELLMTWGKTAYVVSLSARRLGTAFKGEQVAMPTPGYTVSAQFSTP